MKKLALLSPNWLVRCRFQQQLRVYVQHPLLEHPVLKLHYHSLRSLRGPRWLRIGLRMALIPFWFAKQAAAVLLDRNNPAPPPPKPRTIL